MFADFWDARWLPYPMTEWWFVAVVVLAVGWIFSLLLNLLVIFYTCINRK